MTNAEIGAVALRLVSDAADAILVADPEGRITVWNRGAERIFGFSEAEAIGQSLDLVIPERLRDRHWTGYRQTMATGKSRYGAGDLLSVPALTKDGRTISVEFTVMPLAGADGKLVGIAAILRDVTQRFEELKRLRRELAQR